MRHIFYILVIVFILSLIYALTACRAWDNTDDALLDWGDGDDIDWNTLNEPQSAR